MEFLPEELDRLNEIAQRCHSEDYLVCTKLEAKLLARALEGLVRLKASNDELKEWLGETRIAYHEEVSRR